MIPFCKFTITSAPASMNIYSYVCTFIYIHIHTNICNMYIYMYIYICIYILPSICKKNMCIIPFCKFTMTSAPASKKIYSYICTFIYIHIYVICIYICIYILPSICKTNMCIIPFCKFTITSAPASRNIYSYVCTFIYIHIHTYICNMYIYICIYIYVYIYMYINSS
jgi:hypothetical protein